MLLKLRVFIVRYLNLFFIFHHNGLPIFILLGALCMLSSYKPLAVPASFSAAAIGSVTSAAAISLALAVPVHAAMAWAARNDASVLNCAWMLRLIRSISRKVSSDPVSISKLFHSIQKLRSTRGSQNWEACAYMAHAQSISPSFCLSPAKCKHIWAVCQSGKAFKARS